MLLLLATTHPWSGLELLLTINLWRSFRRLPIRHSVAAIQLAAAVLMLGAFLSYYRLWLPSFEQHAAQQRVWEVEWTSMLVNRNNLMTEDTLMWGSDYPHTDGIWPESTKYIAEQFEGLTLEQIQKITCDNAVDFYGLH